MKKRLVSLSCLLLAVTAARAAKPPASAVRNTARITWLGHAAFEVLSPGGTRPLIDPWFTGNDKAPAEWKDLKRVEQEEYAAILVTYSHGDHVSDVPELARLSGAPVVSTGETVRFLKIPEAQQMAVNVGGAIRVGDVDVHVVPAMHSSEPGAARWGSCSHSRTASRSTTLVTPGFLGTWH